MVSVTSSGNILQNYNFAHIPAPKQKTEAVNFSWALADKLDYKTDFPT